MFERNYSTLSIDVGNFVIDYRIWRGKAKASSVRSRQLCPKVLNQTLIRSNGDSRCLKKSDKIMKCYCRILEISIIAFHEGRILTIDSWYAF